MEDTTAQTILEAVEKKDLTGAEIHALFGNHINKTRLGEALSSLIASGRITKVQAKGKGRPMTIYRLRETSCEKREKRELNFPASEVIPLNSHNSLNSQRDGVKPEMIEVEL